MIELTRLNGHQMVLNSDLIKTAEASPDTMLTLINGEKLIVREDCAEVQGYIVAESTHPVDVGNAHDNHPIPVRNGDPIRPRGRGTAVVAQSLECREDLARIGSVALLMHAGVHALQGRGQALVVDRLQEVVDRVNLERADRVVIECGDEHDAWLICRRERLSDSHPR